MKLVILSTALLGALAAPAFAATTATSSTDLNLRSGPGVNAEIMGVIAEGDAVEVEGCIAEQNWCKVMYNGMEGWAYGSYLNGGTADEAMYLDPTPNRDQVISVVTQDNAGEGSVVGGTLGAGAVALAAGGPLAIVGGAIAGAVAGDFVVPDETVTYVRSNPVEPIYVDGEVVRGAKVPAEVTTYPIPESEYTYVMLNGVPVILDQDGVIVRVVR